MSYLKDFLKHIAKNDYPGFLKLWEEYCSGDQLDGAELVEILKAAKASSFREYFGKHVERILPLWELLENNTESHAAFKLIVDLETTNDATMGEKVFQYLEDRYGKDENFQEKIRLIGLRDRRNFQYAISNYELLSHIGKGKFVFHTAGWGVGMILDFSLLREQVTLEFDYVAGSKDLSFDKTFKTLIPIPDDHFLAQRFGDPDALEAKAKKDPVGVIELLLRDLGPTTASEIKDELCELVIPAKDWTKWWQSARSKIKKSTLIDTPADIRQPFVLRKTEVSHEERLQKALASKPDVNTLIQMVYSFLKDFPETLKNASFKNTLCERLQEILGYADIPAAQKLQVYFFLMDLGVKLEGDPISELLSQAQTLPSVQEILNNIQILSFKKRALAVLRKTHLDWKDLFLNLLILLEHGTLRDYALSELLASKSEEEIQGKMEELVRHPSKNPDAFLWCFQKVLGQKKIPFPNMKAKVRLFESLLILLNHAEKYPELKDLVKKIHGILSEKRYAAVRKMMQEASVEEVKEFLLLTTKCHSLEDHDIKILRSLAEVAHPSLAKLKKKDKSATADEDVIWTTQEGCLKTKKRIEHIATVETVENAKEIEVARAHGDLRENSEFKFALEKRDRLQGELKLVSDQLNKARVLTAGDISTDHVGIGCVVECESEAGKKTTYTLLGPWDADPEKNILSFQSKLAQSMNGLSVKEKFQIQGETFTITAISSYL